MPDWVEPAEQLSKLYIDTIAAGDGSGREHCVWAVAVLADGTMASGDAGGGVALWDARLGTRLAAFSRHRADVLALAASPDGAALFAAGVDSQVELHLYQSLQCAQCMQKSTMCMGTSSCCLC